MVKADLGDALLFFEPSYLVRTGMEAFLVTRSSDRYFIDTLSELEGALKGGSRARLLWSYIIRTNICMMYCGSF